MSHVDILAPPYSLRSEAIWEFSVTGTLTQQVTYINIQALNFDASDWDQIHPLEIDHQGILQLELPNWVRYDLLTRLTHHCFTIRTSFHDISFHITMPLHRVHEWPPYRIRTTLLYADSFTIGNPTATRLIVLDTPT